MYIYPENLKSKAKLWLWELKDIGIIGIGSLISALTLTQFRIFIPALITTTYAFLTIRLDEVSIMDFIKYSTKYFFNQQYFEWGGGMIVKKKQKTKESSKRTNRVKNNN